MSHPKFLLAPLFQLAVMITAVNAFNVTNILSQYGDFSVFNDQLSQTQLAGEINRRRTITVLAVDNGNASPLTSQPQAVEKKILSLHVVLDYYDVQKLKNMKNKSFLLTTLYQASGQATSQLGFLNVTRPGSDQIMFGSAYPGSTPVASLVKSVYSQPYNISILQISSIIAPAGITDGASASAPESHSSNPPPPPDNADSSPPATSPEAAEAPATVSDGPVTADGPAPTDATAADESAGKSLTMATRLGKLELGVGLLVWFAWFFWMI